MKISIILIFVLIALFTAQSVFADRDWEYWSGYSAEIPLVRDNEISYAIIPEWRMKDDMSYRYLFKLEQAVNFKLGDYWVIAPYYVWQENKTPGGRKRFDMSYLDLTGKLPLKRLFDAKITNRLRWHYNYDTGLTLWRNITKLTRGFKVWKAEVSPFIADEIFYNVKMEKFSENRAFAGISFAAGKNINIDVSYMLNTTRKKGSDWNYANVLVTSFILRF